ncbi:hypothetical protein, conserved [Eimeria praecox]|uniref:Uncharacterized protein n=1 Tax=Eimeria praecox TaxID=51316 RepID=U6G1Q0_9EIME|nr:hypothetical protein, conserved [Eimeria praecox]
MDLGLDSQPRLLPCSLVESPLGRASKEMPAGSGKPVPRHFREQHGTQEGNLDASGAYFVCPTGETEDPHNEPGGPPMQIDEGAPPEPALWISRPAAALSSIHAVTPWGKILLWTLAIIGCLDCSAKAEGVLGIKDGGGAATLAQAYMAGLGAISHGPRLAEIHPSFFDATSDASDESSSEPLTESEGKRKKQKGFKKLKSAFARKNRGNTRPRSDSQESLVVSGSDESEGEVEQAKPGTTDEMPTEGPKKKRSLLKLFRSKRPQKQKSAKQTRASEQKEVFEAIEAAAADGDSCLKIMAGVDTGRAGYFPHEMQSIRQGLLIYAACERLLEDLKQSNGIPLPPAPGSSVKILDDFLHASEPVFTVQAVEGQTALLDGMENAVGVAKLISAPNPVEVGFVDTALNGSWHTVEKEDPDMFARLLDFATQSGYGETLETGRKTGNFGGLLHSLKEKSSVFGIVVGTRLMLGAPIPQYPSGRKAHKKWKDISAKYSIFTAVEAMKMLEVLQIVLLQHALPGCLPLNAVSLMMQPSLLLARLLDRFMAGSPLMGPVGQQLTDNPVNRAYLISTASPIQDVGQNAQLRSQCAAGVFAELGLNAAAVEKLSCHSHWRREQGMKGRHGLLPPGSLSSCNSDCLIKASLRNGWANKETEKHRKAYRLKPHDARIGDALRMATFYSPDEILELDKKVAAAWLAAKLLLDASREQTKSISPSIPSDAELEAGPSSLMEPKPHRAESGESRLSPIAVHTLSSSGTESGSLLQDARKLPAKSPGHTPTSQDPHAFVVGGSVNINATNIIATASLCKLLLETDLTNPMLFASSVLTNLRGYVNDAGAGLDNTETQRKLAKRSDVFSAMYKCLSCGLGGELLPPLFAPYASTALQVGAFLRVEVEESKALPWERIVQTMGDGVFTTRAYASGVKHLEKKAAHFLEMFTPCMAEVAEASDLLMLSQATKSTSKFASRLKKALNRAKRRRRRANEGMCEMSGELQQLVRLLVVWWVLGPSSSESAQGMPQSFENTAATFKSARLVFAFLIFNNGHDQAKVAMELVTAACKNRKFVVPPGWALGSRKGSKASREVSFKDISKDISASLMYLESSLGSRGISEWLMPLTAAQQLADICALHPVVELADLLSTDAGSMILMGHQCIKLQDEGIKLISGVLGKRSKTEDEGYSHVLLQFLKGINAWRATKGFAGLSQAFGRYASSSEGDQQAVLTEWNEDFPNVECPWKKNKRAQKAMIRKGTSYQNSVTLPGKAAAQAIEFHCPAHPPLRLQDLAEVRQPEATQFCADSSSQCTAFDYNTEMQNRL